MERVCCPVCVFSASMWLVKHLLVVRFTQLLRGAELGVRFV